jgi:hypothetical protein
MESWDGWELGRWIVLFAAFLYVGIWAQLTLYHWRAAFRRREMYAPVILTPVIAAAGALGAIEGDGIFGWISLVAFAIGVVEGLGGLFFHMQGVRYLVGGITLRNLAAGPPPVLPVAYSLAGVLGLLGLLLND